MLKKAIYDVEFKALPGSTGEFEAYVSVFGNVDLQGDRVLPGAFSKSIDEWRASGDPIPVIWSHDWENPMAHIGTIDPSNAVQDARGLRVKGQMDINTNPFAAQVYKLLQRRSVKEWSFAYEIHKQKVASDGANNLMDLGIIEAGPTLKGANGLTNTLAAKSLIRAAATDQRFKDDPGLRALIYNLRDSNEFTAGTPYGHGLDIFGEKIGPAYASKQAVAGSTEERQSAIQGALQTWVHEQDPTDTSEWIWIQATFDDHVIAERSDNEGPSQYLNFPYTIDADGNVTLGKPSEVGLETIVTGKEETMQLHAKGGTGPATDDSAWDGSAAMSAALDSDDPAAAFRAICAGERSAGDPSEEAHWALPHHKAPGDPANVAGVRNARARLTQTQGLSNEAAARRHLFEVHKLPSEVEGAADEGDGKKSGRTISAKNEKSLRDARDLIDGVLSGLSSDAEASTGKDQEATGVKSEDSEGNKDEDTDAEWDELRAQLKFESELQSKK